MDSQETEVLEDIEENIFTYGITVHDGMESSKFMDSINSVLESYNNLMLETPIDIIISIDAETEEEFLKRANVLKLNDYEKDEMLRDFRKNKEEKRKYIKEIKERIVEEKLNISLDVIESTEKYGKVSASRNRIIDLCKTKYLAFLDGDDKIQQKALQHCINECMNNEWGNTEGRKNYKNPGEIIKGEADIIYLEKNNGKSPCGIIYNSEALKNNNIRFPTNIGSEDGYVKALLLQQKDLKVVYADENNMGIIYDYTPSNSTIADDKNYEPIIQLVNHLVRHNKKGMQIYNKDFIGNKNIPIDPNNVMQYFNSSYECNGYGSFFGTDKAELSSKICFVSGSKKDIETISAITSSLILYPEVLSNGKDKDFFLEVRKKLKEEIERNGSIDISILDILRNTKGFDEMFKNMKNNFEEPEVFEKYFNEIDNYLRKDDKKEVFDKILLELNIDEKTNQLKEIENIH